MLFSDIRGFTRLSEVMPLEAVASFLNGYFRLASDIFIRRDAIVDKFLGDCTMAVFGAPIVRPDHPRQGVEAGVELLTGYRKLFTGLEHPLALGIGINTGDALVGNVGSHLVKDWTAIGDTVNVASRLQSMAGAGEILMTEATYREVNALYPALAGRTVSLEGRGEPVTAYSLIP